MLAVIMVVGAIAPIIIQPTVGMISDYTVTRWGRRKPYIVDRLAASTSSSWRASRFSNDVRGDGRLLLPAPGQLELRAGPVPGLRPRPRAGEAGRARQRADGARCSTLGHDRSASASPRSAGITDNISARHPGAGRRGGGDDARAGPHRRRGHGSGPKRTRPWRGDRPVGMGDATSSASATCCGCSLVRLLFLGAYDATLDRASATSAARTACPTADADTIVFVGTAIVGVIDRARGDPGWSDVGPIRPPAGDLDRGAHRRDRPARRGVRAHAGVRDRLVGAVRDRDGDLPVGGLGADDRRHPQADGRALHGHPQCRHRHGRPVFLIVAGPVQDLVSAATSATRPVRARRCSWRVALPRSARRWR